MSWRTRWTRIVIGPLASRGHRVNIINGLSAAKAAIAPIKDKKVVAIPKPRERIQPLTPKLANSKTIPERNAARATNQPSEFSISHAVADPQLALLSNVIPSVTGR